MYDPSVKFSINTNIFCLLAYDSTVHTCMHYVTVVYRLPLTQRPRVEYWLDIVISGLRSFIDQSHKKKLHFSCSSGQFCSGIIWN